MEMRTPSPFMQSVGPRIEKYALSYYGIQNRGNR